VLAGIGGHFNRTALTTKLQVQTHKILLIRIKMNKRLIYFGIISCSLLIVIQLTAGFIELLHYDHKIISFTMNMLNMILNISIFTIIWRVLVKYYEQKQFNSLIKAMIVIMILITLFLTINMVIFPMIILLLTAGLSLINFILFFVFLSRIMDLEKYEVKRIKYLQNYSLSFLICLIGQFVLAALIEFKKTDAKFLNHLLLLVPSVFILLFFIRIKDDIAKNVNTYR
jgi:hypothetical protein